jgi:Protein of Unknown function (DUF2784)
VTFRILADAVLVLHFAFIAFVVAGGLFVLRWPKLAWVHLPAAAWGAIVMFTGGVCPLTPLENRLRIAGGGEAYAGDFISHYLGAVIYPAGITREIQWVLGALVIAINAGAYFHIWRRKRGQEL